MANILVLSPPKGPFWLHAFIIAASTLFPADSPAHGTRPMVHKVLTVNEEGLKNLQTPRGFAQRLPDGRWHLVCPWFSNKSLLPVALGASDESIRVPGNTDFYHIRDGVPHPTNQPEFNAGSVRGLVALHNQTYLLRSAPPAGSELFELFDDSPPELIHEFEVPWKAIWNKGDELYLGLARSNTLSVLGFDPTSSTVTFEASWSAPGIAKLHQLAQVGHSLYAAVRFIDRNSLLRLDEGRDTPIEVSSGVYQANLPLWLNDSLITIIDSQVMRIEEDQVHPVPVNAEEVYEMFHHSPLGTLLSTSRGMYRFTDFSTPPEELFLFSELHPPKLDGQNERDLAFCETHWHDLHRDWQLPETPFIRQAPNQAVDPVPTPPLPDKPPPPPWGCAQTNPTLLLCLVPLLRRWRSSARRTRASRRAPSPLVG